MSTDSAQRADRYSLGKYTGLAVTGCENSGEPSPDDKRRANLTLRYDLQDAAKHLLRNEPEGKRLIHCMVMRVDALPEGLPNEVPADVVVIERDGALGRARYKNLVHCDSPWTCPICSSRRTEADKREVNRAYLAARARGWTCIMVTYTQRHDRGTSLEHLLTVNQNARRWFKSNSRLHGDTWGSLKETHGFIGGIINLECTHGDNSWHPHNHELIFIDPEKASSDDIDELRWTLAERWQSAVRKFGGDCDLHHGLHIRTGDDAISEYLAKFGHEPEGKSSLESEMTKGSAKIGKREGRTPFQLLYDFKFDGDRQAGALFVEFARHFTGRAHLRWSQGLRELLDLENFELPVAESMTEILAAEKPVYAPFIAIPDDCWKRVILSQYGRRSAFLLACEAGAIDAAEMLAHWGYTGEVYWLSPPDAPVPHMTAKPAPPVQVDFGWQVAGKKALRYD